MWWARSTQSWQYQELLEWFLNVCWDFSPTCVCVYGKNVIGCHRSNILLGDWRNWSQANTVKDKKVFSYFTLGKLIIEHNRINQLIFDESMLAQVIQNELSRKW